MTNDQTNTIDAAALSEYERQANSTRSAKIEAMLAIRQRFGSLAKKAIKIGHFEPGWDGFQDAEQRWLSDQGRDVKAIRVHDTFIKSNRKYSGQRLFLAADCWVEIERVGYYGEKEDEIWTCGEEIVGYSEGGYVRHLSDADAVDEGYDPACILDAVADELEKMMAQTGELAKEEAIARKILAELTTGPT